MGGSNKKLIDDDIHEFDGELVTGIPKAGHGLEALDRTTENEDVNDSGSFHNLSLGALSYQKKEGARPGTSNPEGHGVSRHSS